MSASKFHWYVRRLGRMSPAEMAWRARDQAVKAAWARRQVKTDADLPAPPAGLRFGSALPAGTADRVPDEARKAVIGAADQLMRGEWDVLGILRTDMEDPDWFIDPDTGRRSDPGQYAFAIDHRSPDQTGNVKQVWEISRLQHLTLLATAWYLTGEERYATRVASQLRSWWRQNPFLSGVHWTSGIEVGIRLVSFVWIRRLLDTWPGAPGLFEQNPLALAQIRWHQEYLDGLRSRGSSANNHVIAEAAGQLVASCAFPWFPRSSRWRRRSALLLERELIKNTFPSGIDRELASDYQCLVAMLGVLAAIEVGAAGHPVSEKLWTRVCAMFDSGAAMLDDTLRPPRQGDGDEGRAILLDGPGPNPWPGLLAVGDAVFGRLDWWRRPSSDAGSILVGALAGAVREVADRPRLRPSRFPDAGLTILRTETTESEEIWCRCDGGPHGFLSIAAHAHADALSVEVRYGGVDILADPGTYCYHGEQEWRSYFRSTLAHNTVEIGGHNQSLEGGPFMWLRHAATRELEVPDPEVSWTGEHDGYKTLAPPARHRRTVQLDRVSRTIEITDVVSGASHDVRLTFHLGPDVEAELSGTEAVLSWSVGSARFELPRELEWSLHRGETEPMLGWYSPGLGHRIPTVTLLGQGRCGARVPLITRLFFPKTESLSDFSASSRAVPLSARGAEASMAPASGAEAR